MKKMVLGVVFVFVALLSSSAGAEYLGSMAPVTKTSNVSLGMGYSFYSDKIDIASNSFDLKQNQAFLQFAASVGDIEGYIRVGGADLRINDAFNPNVSGGKVDFEDDTFKAYLTVGGRGAIRVDPNFSFNPFIQATFYPDFKDKAEGTVGAVRVIQEVEASFYKVETGVFFQGNLKALSFYIGPFAYWIRGDVTARATLVGYEPRFSGNTEFEEKGNIGGAAGIRIPLGGHFALDLEGQYRQRFSAGGMITYSFK